MIRALTSVGGRNAEHRYQLEWPGSGDHRDLRYRHRCPGSYHLTTQCERGRLFSCQPLDALADDRAGVAGFQHFLDYLDRPCRRRVCDRHLGLQLRMDGRLGAGVHPFVVEDRDADRSEEHTSELQSLMRISYAVSCL